MNDTGWVRGPIEAALDTLAAIAAGRTQAAYLDELASRPAHQTLDDNLEQWDLARRAIVTGLDMGIAFAVAFPEAAKRVQEVVRVGAGLTEADEAQRLLLFAELVEATR